MQVLSRQEIGRTSAAAVDQGVADWADEFLLAAFGAAVLIVVFLMFGQ